MRRGCLLPYLPTLLSPQSDGAIDAVGGLLVYLSAPEEQAAAVAGAAGRGSTGGGGGGGGGDSPRFHYTSLVPALWPEQRGLLVMRNRLAAAVLQVKALNAGLGGEVAGPTGHLPSASLCTAATQQVDPSGPCGSGGSGAAAAAAAALPRASPLPPLLQEVRTCSKCYMFTACTAVYVAQELPLAEARAAAAAAAATAVGAAAPAAAAPVAYGDEEDAGTPLLENLAESVKGLYAGVLAHVGGPLRAYLGRWLRLVDLEASAGLLVAEAEDAAPVAAPAHAAAGGVDIEDLAGGGATRMARRVVPQKLRAGADHRSRLWMDRAENLEGGLGTTASRLVLVRQVGDAGRQIYLGGGSIEVCACRERQAAHIVHRPLRRSA